MLDCPRSPSTSLASSSGRETGSTGKDQGISGVASSAERLNESTSSSPRKREDFVEWIYFRGKTYRSSGGGNFVERVAGKFAEKGCGLNEIGPRPFYPIALTDFYNFEVLRNYVSTTEICFVHSIMHCSQKF
ncbi:unnamed protein product [Strongylus vulgaris]|uniref:Uncharacterized protein n=1 Tax=Strongylus vulgaris TaxID=40348 RepID=A0A3P7JMZ9_STRVU|nr:unnamed protein product [Strongylus vulgaris]